MHGELGCSTPFLWASSKKFIHPFMTYQSETISKNYLIWETNISQASFSNCVANYKVICASNAAVWITDNAPDKRR